MPHDLVRQFVPHRLPSEMTRAPCHCEAPVLWVPKYSFHVILHLDLLNDLSGQSPVRFPRGPERPRGRFDGCNGTVESAALFGQHSLLALQSAAAYSAFSRLAGRLAGRALERGTWSGESAPPVLHA